MPCGSLTVAGTGIQAVLHLTPQARGALEHAEVALYLVADAIAEAWIEGLAPSGRSLRPFYEAGRDRDEIYRDMVEEILVPVRADRRVCALFYGHPGVFAVVGHEAVRKARDEGFAAEMLPAISTEDCLFADLGVDPGATGCQSYDATDLVLHRRGIDPSAALVVWQITAIGMARWEQEPAAAGLPVLLEYLLRFYPAAHEVVLYEASPLPVAGPRVRHIRLADFPQAELSPLSTLYVPPAERREPDPKLMERLGLRAEADAPDRAS
jgi:uncharacterized protein YabN with tetrapyrrole methylase and pyrophosphatase domain